MKCMKPTWHQFDWLNRDKPPIAGARRGLFPQKCGPHIHQPQFRRVPMGEMWGIRPLLEGPNLLIHWPGVDWYGVNIIPRPSCHYGFLLKTHPTHSEMSKGPAADPNQLVWTSGNQASVSHRIPEMIDLSENLAKQNGHLPTKFPLTCK